MKAAHRLLALAAVVVALSPASRASAADFEVSKSIAAGTISFTDNNSALPVTELLVAADVLNGISGNPGTTLTGFSTENLSFGTDPLNCNPPSLGATFPTAVCYKLTGPGGSPITGGVTTFTYDSSFDITDPAEFAVVFDLPNGSTGACFGNTGPNGGCDATIPEPPAAGLLIMALFGLAGLTRLRIRT